MMRRIRFDRNLMIPVLLLVLLVMGAVAVVQYSVVTSGVQGLSAKWTRVAYQEDYEYRPTDPTHFSFDPTIEGWTAPLFQDWVQYQAETDQPKYEEVLNELEAIRNETTQKVYQYARLERWSLSVDLYALSAGGLYSPAGVKFFLQLKTNPDAVFSNADDATAYVVHAYVTKYEQLGTGSELVLPSQGAFSLYLADTENEVRPTDFDDLTSVIDLDKVRMFETVEIQFETSDFAISGWFLGGYTDAHVHYIISLDVLVIGQWVLPLDEDLGGENQAGASGRVGWFDSLSRSISSFFEGFEDWFSAFWWVIPIVLVSISVLVIFIFAKVVIIR